MSNPPSLNSADKPLIHCHIILKDIKQLLCHEQVVQSQVDWLKKNLLELGYFFRPIIIAKKFNIILDGHHRVIALKQLGYTKVPCIELKNYLEDDTIFLGTWYPIYVNKNILINFPSDLKKIGVTWETLDRFYIDILNDPKFGFTLKTKKAQYLIHGSQNEIYEKFLTHFNSNHFEYVKSIDFALESVESGQALFALLRSPITKENVIKRASQKELFAPKTTRHDLAFRYQDIKVPLENLK